MDYQREITEPNDFVSRMARKLNVSSYSNNKAIVIVQHDPENFRGPVGIAWAPHVIENMARNRFRLLKNGSYQISSWVMLEETGNDGAGSKPQYATLIGTPEVFRGISREIIRMNAEDFARSGRFPVYMTNDLSVKQITRKNLPLLKAFLNGYGEGLAESNLVSICGETALMPWSITAFCDDKSDDQLVLTHSGTCVGLSHCNRLIRAREEIIPGLAIVL